MGRFIIKQLELHVRTHYVETSMTRSLAEAVELVMDGKAIPGPVEFIGASQESGMRADQHPEFFKELVERQIITSYNVDLPSIFDARFVPEHLHEVNESQFADSE